MKPDTFVELEDDYIQVYEQVAKGYNVMLDDDIGEPKKYRRLVNYLFNSTENDVFNITLNTQGGSLSGAIQIIEAIKATKASVSAIILGECHSAGSIIALNCHNIIVADSAHMMIHTASYGTGGNTGNVKKHVDFSTKMIDKLIDTTYKGFLNTTEIAEVKKGVEFWFDAKEITKRLKAKFSDVEEKKTKKTKPEILVE